MPITEEDLDLSSQNPADRRAARARRPYDSVDREEGAGAYVATAVGALLLLSVVGAIGYGLYRMFADMPAPAPQTSAAARPKMIPGAMTEFVIGAPKADQARYTGAIDTYMLRPMDAARQLTADLANRDAALINDIDSSPEFSGGGKPKAKKGPPGKGCTVADVQKYFAEQGFPELPSDLCWGYDPETGKVYLGMK